MKTARLLFAIVAAAGLAGCAAPAPAPAPPATAASDPSGSSGASSSNDDSCLVLAGGTFDDATDFFIDYTTDPESVSVEDLESVMTRIDAAAAGSDTQLSNALNAANEEFGAIETRLTGGDPLTPVRYEVIQDSLNDAMDTCRAVLQQ